MILDVLTLQDCQLVRMWRNQCLGTLRTSNALTEKQQEDFYYNTICNPSSPHRYYGIYENAVLIGMGGITNIQWENSIGEISLIINPALHGQGIGTKAVNLLLDEAFNRLNLKTVCGECYECNPAVNFWKRIVQEHKGYSAVLCNRKYSNGQYYNSYYFSMDRDVCRLDTTVFQENRLS